MDRNVGAELLNTQDPGWLMFSAMAVAAAITNATIPIV